jgi:archaetidylinositol phosphate synthase
MTLDALRPVADRVVQPTARLASRLGLTGNAVSVVAFSLSLAAALAFALAGGETGWLAPLDLESTQSGLVGARWLYLVGSLLVVANGWLDLLDGAIAREQGTESPSGDLLDHVLDRYADVAVVAGLAAGIGSFAIGFVAVTGVLLTSYLGTQAQALGAGRAYGGLVGRADRLVLVAVGTGFAWLAPTTIAGLSLVGWILVVLAVAGHVTAVQRSVLVYRALE